VVNLDDLLRQMRADELADQLETTGTAKPIDYAKMRGLVPQQVYYRIRTGKLDSHKCECGNTVINVKEADVLFGFTPKPEVINDTE
jgi:hypothetical protein